MGQCGCGDTVPDFQFPGPGGVTYGIQIYPSCHYCGTPVGVDVYRFDPAETGVWLDGVPEAPFHAYNPDEPTNAQLSIPILDPVHLREPLAEVCEEDEVDLAVEEIRLGMATAVSATLDAWRTEVAARDYGGSDG